VCESSGGGRKAFQGEGCKAQSIVMTYGLGSGQNSASVQLRPRRSGVLIVAEKMRGGEHRSEGVLGWCQGIVDPAQVT
jgi:hypothetical protein